MHDVGHLRPEIALVGAFEEGTEDLGPRPEGGGTLRFRAPPPGHRGTAIDGSPGQFLGQAGLADAGLPRDEDQAASALAGEVEGGHQGGHLPCPPHHRPPVRPGSGPGADVDPGSDRIVGRIPATGSGVGVRHPHLDLDLGFGFGFGFGYEGGHASRPGLRREHWVGIRRVGVRRVDVRSVAGRVAEDELLGRRWLPIQRGGMGQDVVLDAPQRRRRIDSELLGQDHPGPGEGAEGVPLATRAVEGDHQQPPEVLPQRPFRNCQLEFGHGPCVLPERQLAANQSLERSGPHLVEPHRFHAGKRLARRTPRAPVPATARALPRAPSGRRPAGDLRTAGGRLPPAPRIGWHRTRRARGATCSPAPA